MIKNSFIPTENYIYKFDTITYIENDYNSQKKIKVIYYELSKL